MKNYGSTVIMAILVAAVGGFAIYEYKKGEQEETAKAKEGRLFPEKEVDFNSITFFSANAPTLQLIKDKNSWSLKVPVQDAADETAVESLLSDLESQKAKTLETEGTPNWSQYGLDELGHKLELVNSNKKIYTVVISRKAAFDGSYYLKFADHLMLGASAWGRIVEKTASDLRDKAFLPTPLNVKALTIEGKSHVKVSLKKVDGKWEFAKAGLFPVDAVAVEDLISNIRGLRATSFISEDQNAKAMNEAGLRSPKIRVSMELDDKNLHELNMSIAFKKEGSDAFVTASHRPQIFKVAKASVEKLDKLPEDFRDRRQPFQFNLEAVQFVRIETPLTKVMLKKVGSNWSLEQPEAGKQLDTDRLQDLFSKLKGLVADDFLTNKKGRGLENAKNTISLADAQNKEIFRLVWGEEYKKDPKGSPLFYVKTSNSKELMGVKTGALMALPVQTLLKSTETPQPVVSKPLPIQKTR